MRVLTKKDLILIFVRSFYIQGSWNFQRMLNLGFCYCLIPVMKKLYTTEEEQKRFLKRHLEFFNAHPYFASFALGATARLEEQYSREDWKSERPISVLKNRLCGPLGAIGDQLFWGGVRPLVAMIGVITTIFFGFIGPVVLFILYNVPHLYLRYYGVVRGYELGFDIVRELSKRKFRQYSEYLGLIGLIVLGIFVALYSLTLINSRDWSLVLLFLISMLITFPFIRWRKPIILPIFVTISMFVIYVYVF